MQKTLRPGQINTDVWRVGDAASKAKWRREWKHLGPNTERERSRRQLPAKIPWGEETNEYNEIMTPLRSTLGIPEAPAMSCTPYELPTEVKDEHGEIICINPEQQ